MRLSKTSNFSGISKSLMSDDEKKKAEMQYVNDLDSDVKNLFLWSNGRVRFFENIAGSFVTFTSSATPDAENTVAHNLGLIPQGYIVVGRDKAGILYNSTTAFTTTNLYLKCNVASVTFSIYIIK